MRNEVNISARFIAEYFLPAFKACVQDAKVKSIMCSCQEPTPPPPPHHPTTINMDHVNTIIVTDIPTIPIMSHTSPRNAAAVVCTGLMPLHHCHHPVRMVTPTDNGVNGVPSCANGAFQNGILRDQWGWDGYITSDCGALDVVPGPPPHLSGLLGNGSASTGGVLSTWGGAVVQGTGTRGGGGGGGTDSGKWHMFAAAMLGGCGIKQWGSNSEIVRAVADAPTGQ